LSRLLLSDSPDLLHLDPHADARGAQAGVSALRPAPTHQIRRTRRYNRDDRDEKDKEVRRLKRPHVVSKGVESCKCKEVQTGRKKEVNTPRYMSNMTG
jgi:hypothetical protein